MKNILLPLISATFLITSSAQADMYKWVDENGTITFKDTPPPRSKKRAKVKVYPDSDFAPVPAPAPIQQNRGSKSTTFEERVTAPAPVKQAKVRFLGAIEMYVTDWCPSCKAAEKYIASKNYPVVKYDIEKDKSAQRRYQELGGRGVPLILIGSNRMSGFSAQLLEQYLGNE
ncbi:MAG TPA: DUF4124 domain-containing protein [Desulfuromonadaceae bacterium]|jgi:glutaredoxin